ncbi:hypothetical protein BKA93DRAFT_827665 [Sparassis latifolia]
MSSPVRRQLPRLRSQSASSPIRGIQYTDDSEWRTATKRARPSHRRSPSLHDLPSDELPENRGMDQRLRGKRARRDTAPHWDVQDEQCALPSGSRMERSGTAHTPASDLASTSAAFQLYPHRQKKDRRTAHHGLHRTESVIRRGGERRPSSDLHRLRSDAFGELHRSVADSGEGLVRRMRDWEHSRRIPTAIPARRRDARWSYYAPVTPDVEDEEVEIVSAAPDMYLHTRSPSHKKRAYSLGMMEVDMPDILPPFSPTVGSEGYSSPIDGFSGISVCSSDDEELFPTDQPFGSSSTPELSHTYTNSANSSLISLPLSLSSPHGPSHHPYANRTVDLLDPQSVHVPSSASEKAVDALILAMANGAGGVNDYEALRQAEGSSSGEPSDVGELWH